MPNHIHNRMTFQCDREKAAQIKKEIANGESVIDFNKLIPMPKRLSTTQAIGNAPDAAMFAMTGKGYWFKDFPHALPINYNAEVFREYLKMITNIRRYGFPTWYEWASEKWGTKWNAYDCGEENQRCSADQIVFDTAWSSPKKIAIAISHKYAIRVLVEYVCEFADHGGLYTIYMGSEMGDRKFTADECEKLISEIAPDEITIEDGDK